MRIMKVDMVSSLGTFDKAKLVLERHNHTQFGRRGCQLLPFSFDAGSFLFRLNESDFSCKQILGASIHDDAAFNQISLGEPSWLSLPRRRIIRSLVI